MMWPIEGMHWLLRLPAYFSPMQLSVEAARSVISQGSNPLVIGLGFLSAGGWCVILALATLVLLRFQNKTG